MLPSRLEGHMATRLDCDAIPSGVCRCSPGRDSVHELLKPTSIILDFPVVGIRTSGIRSAGRRVARGLSGGAITKALCRVTTIARRSKVVARDSDPPQYEHTGLRSLRRRPGAGSGKGIPMDRHRDSIAADESHESAKKNLTRRQPHTLRSRQSSENAGTPFGFILIHGATDASGR